LTGILDGHHKERKAVSVLDKKIATIYEMETRARGCGDNNRAKSLKKRCEARLKKGFLTRLEESLLLERGRYCRNHWPLCECLSITNIVVTVIV
jgi:hypothetical protein